MVLRHQYTLSQGNRLLHSVLFCCESWFCVRRACATAPSEAASWDARGLDAAQPAGGLLPSSSSSSLPSPPFSSEEETNPGPASTQVLPRTKDLAPPSGSSHANSSLNVTWLKGSTHHQTNQLSCYVMVISYNHLYPGWWDGGLICFMQCTMCNCASCIYMHMHRVDCFRHGSFSNWTLRYMFPKSVYFFSLCIFFTVIAGRSIYKTRCINSLLLWSCYVASLRVNCELQCRLRLPDQSPFKI